MFEFLRKLIQGGTDPQKKGSSARSKESTKQKSDVPAFDPNAFLQTIQLQIEAVAKDCIAIKIEPDAPAPTLASSKIGGNPYFPADEPWPMDKNGSPMRLLAQLNFAEMPALEPFPAKGLLQFFLSVQDGLFGLNFDDPIKQENWRVFFFPDLNFEPSSDWNELGDIAWEEGPLVGDLPLAVSFNIRKDYPVYPSLEYYQHIDPLLAKVGDVKLQEMLEDHYLDQEYGVGHKLGGFPYFTQNEVRDLKPEFEDYQLLFQLDTEWGYTLWGDMGVANFFIHKEDLKKQRFDRILYNWDCH